MKRSPFKRKAPKKRAGHDSLMLQACRGQPCYLDVPGVCCFDRDTVVPCHANWADYGKGAGLKAHDRFTVPGCYTCHAWLDQGKATNAEKRRVWESAYDRWQPYRDAEILTV